MARLKALDPNQPPVVGTMKLADVIEVPHRELLHHLNCLRLRMELLGFTDEFEANFCAWGNRFGEWICTAQGVLMLRVEIAAFDATANQPEHN